MFWCPNTGDECVRKIIQNPESAFLIMPFNYPPEFQSEINLIEKTVIECFEEISFSVKTARDIVKRGNLLCKICENIQSVAVGVVLYTGNTPKASTSNIFYEAGILHNLAKETIFIGYDIEKIPSDLRGLEWIKVDNVDSLRKELKKHLKTLSDLQSYCIKLGLLEEDAKNYEKALEYYIKATLISSEDSLKYLRKLNLKLKNKSEYSNLSERINNFINFL